MRGEGPFVGVRGAWAGRPIRGILRRMAAPAHVVRYIWQEYLALERLQAVPSNLDLFDNPTVDPAWAT